MIAPVVMLDKRLTEFVDNDAQKVVSQVPVISIIEGKASCDEPMPYYIEDPDTGKTLVVIDTTGAITTLSEVNALGLIMEPQAIFRKSNVETRTFSFQNIKDFTLYQDKINGWLSTINKYTIPVLYPLAVLGYFFVRIIQLLLYAAMGLLFASWFKCKRTYSELLRLSVIAVTHCIIIRAFLSLMEINLPVAGL
jgi:hypothetical protein